MHRGGFWPTIGNIFTVVIVQSLGLDDAVAVQ